MYIYWPGQYNIPIEDSLLGRWNDEVLHGEIVKIFGRENTNYSYECIENRKRRSTFKVKGFTLDYDATQAVNFATMMACVRHWHNYSLVLEYSSQIT